LLFLLLQHRSSDEQNEQTISHLCVRFRRFRLALLDHDRNNLLLREPPSLEAAASSDQRLLCSDPPKADRPFLLHNGCRVGEKYRKPINCLKHSMILAPVAHQFGAVY